MIHHTIWLTSGLILTTQCWAEHCTSERARVNEIRQWVASDIESQGPNLRINEEKLKKATELLAQCLSGDVREALSIIAESTDFFCTRTPLETANGELELSSEAKLKLNGIVAKVGDIGLGGAAKSTRKTSWGVRQEDLAKAIKEGDDCRLFVFNRLADRLIPFFPNNETSGDRPLEITADPIFVDFTPRSSGGPRHGTACSAFRDIVFPGEPYSAKVGEPFLFRYDAAPICVGQGFRNFNGTISWDGNHITKMIDNKRNDQFPGIAGTFRVTFSKAGDFNVVANLSLECIDVDVPATACTAHGEAVIHVHN
jgi:hypothetical protein